MVKVFILSVTSMVVYRVIAAYKLWDITRRDDMVRMVEKHERQMAKLKSKSLKMLQGIGSAQKLESVVTRSESKQENIETIDVESSGHEENGHDDLQNTSNVTVSAGLCREGYPGAWWRVLLQLLDLELFHILYLSHTVDLKGSSSPQRMLRVLEAVFEAAPQVKCTSFNIVYTAKHCG